jgi:hypothetical protein
MPGAAPRSAKTFARQSQSLLARGVTIRHALLCSVWLLFTLASLATLFLGFIAIGALLAVLGLHGLIAEFLGLKVDSRGVVAPRRLSASMPFLVLWRERIPLANISKFISASGSWAGERAIIVANSAERKPLFFQNREKRLFFLHLLTQLRPSLSISRI